MSARRLVVATRNPGKVRELGEALARSGLEVVGIEALRGEVPEIEETGTTFEENARLKAEGYSRYTDLPVLADDSGLEVDALGGAPGVQSARYGGPALDDAGRVQVLLRALRAVEPERRTARFRCVLVLAQRGRSLLRVEGRVEGRILDELRGTGGFGYDPVFFHAPSGHAFAELSVSEKRRQSHRGRAVAAFLEALAQRDPRLPAELLDRDEA